MGMQGLPEMTVTGARIRAGVWEGVIEGAASPPAVEVVHQERPVPGVTLAPLPDRPGAHALRVPIPPGALSDGVQTFLVRATPDGRTLAHFTIITGVPMEEDIRAELDLLRAELDMLKRAFRRHCVETSGQG